MPLSVCVCVYYSIHIEVRGQPIGTSFLPSSHGRNPDAFDGWVKSPAPLYFRDKVLLCSPKLASNSLWSQELTMILLPQSPKMFELQLCITTSGWHLCSEPVLHGLKWRQDSRPGQKSCRGRNALQGRQCTTAPGNLRSTPSSIPGIHMLDENWLLKDVPLSLPVHTH